MLSASFGVRANIPYRIISDRALHTLQIFIASTLRLAPPLEVSFYLPSHINFKNRTHSRTYVHSIHINISASSGRETSKLIYSINHTSCFHHHHYHRHSPGLNPWTCAADLSFICIFGPVNRFQELAARTHVNKVANLSHKCICLWPQSPRRFSMGKSGIWQLIFLLHIWVYIYCPLRQRELKWRRIHQTTFKPFAWLKFSTLCHSERSGFGPVILFHSVTPSFCSP